MSKKTNPDIWKKWHDMKQRCLNPNRTNYKYYGGKGVTICKGWLNNFAAFEKWAIESGYAKGLSLDRVDNSKGYSPRNCRWIPMSEQVNNRSCSRLVFYNGETKTVSQWARAYGIEPKTLFGRLYHGIDFETAITKKAKPQHRNKQAVAKTSRKEEDSE